MKIGSFYYLNQPEIQKFHQLFGSDSGEQLIAVSPEETIYWESNKGHFTCWTSNGTDPIEIKSHMYHRINSVEQLIQLHSILN